MESIYDDLMNIAKPYLESLELMYGHIEYWQNQISLLAHKAVEEGKRNVAADTSEVGQLKGDVRCRFDVEDDRGKLSGENNPAFQAKKIMRLYLAELMGEAEKYPRIGRDVD